MVAPVQAAVGVVPALDAPASVSVLVEYSSQDPGLCGLEAAVVVSPGVVAVVVVLQHVHHAVAAVAPVSQHAQPAVQLDGALCAVAVLAAYAVAAQHVASPPVVFAQQPAVVYARQAVAVFAQ